MQTTITARRCEISDELRTRAQAVVDRLAGVAQNPIEANVTFGIEGVAQTAELRFHVAGEVLVAGSQADDHRTALDSAEAKMRKQLTRVSEKLVDRSRRATETPPA